MSYHDKIKMPKRIILHLCLIGFSIAFIFPFFWMICTSIKMPSELAKTNKTLLPSTPNNVNQTPYFDPNYYEKTETLSGTPDTVWLDAKKQITEIINKKLLAWKPVMPGNTKPIEIPENLNKKYFEAMQQGIFNILAKKISYKARETANNINRKIYLEKYPGAKKIPSELEGEAFNEGVNAIVLDSQKLINNKMLSEVFENVFMRICLSSVKVRSNYKIYNIHSKDSWRAASNNTQLATRQSYDTSFELVYADFNENKESEYIYNIPDFKAEDVDRIFVGYRSDASWDRIYFQVSRNGIIYEIKNVINCADGKWQQVELRWYTDDVNPADKKTYFFLENTGKPSGTDKFQIKIIFQKNNIFWEWHDKILRTYREVFRQVPFMRYIFTSFSICLLNIILSVFSCTFIAYAFSRLEWPGKNIFFGIMLATMMLPPQVTMIPSFLINRYLGFYNTLIPLWLFSAFGNAFFIFLLRQFMMTIPKDLEDASRIDGCGFLRIYWHVILPLIKPTIATIALFTFTANWNNFMGPLIYINDESKFPLALGLFKFNLISGTDTGLMMAASFLMTLPIIIIFFYAQKYFIEGITLTGNK